VGAGRADVDFLPSVLADVGDIEIAERAIEARARRVPARRVRRPTAMLPERLLLPLAPPGIFLLPAPLLLFPQPSYRLFLLAILFVLVALISCGHIEPSLSMGAELPRIVLPRLALLALLVLPVTFLLPPLFLLGATPADLAFHRLVLILLIFQSQDHRALLSWNPPALAQCSRRQLPRTRAARVQSHLLWPQLLLALLFPFSLARFFRQPLLLLLCFAPLDFLLLFLVFHRLPQLMIFVGHGIAPLRQCW
jgi:hypothetical protein